MKRTKLKIGVLMAVIAVAILGASTYWTVVTKKNASLAEAGQKLALSQPAFLSSASAAATTLDEEAGISIYLNAGHALNLNVALSKLHIVEYNTSNYVIGSIAIPTNSGGTLGSDEDAHCFVHTAGWIVVYYLNSEPTSKIIDWSWWSGGQLSGSMNKLQAALEEMGTGLGLSLANVHAGAKYYDFRYTDATGLMLIIKTQTNAGTSSFDIELPGNFTFKDESWSHYVQNRGDPNPSTLVIDGNAIDTSVNAGTHYGELPSLLATDTFHTVSVSAVYLYSGLNGGCIVLEYHE